MKKMAKGMTKRLVLSSEKVRTLNPKLLTEQEAGLVAGGQTPTYGTCRACDCSSHMCVD